MITHSIGYAEAWKRLPHGSIVTALAVLAVVAAVGITAQVGIRGDSATPVRSSIAAPFVSAQAEQEFTYYVVSTEEERASLLKTFADRAQQSPEVLVIGADAPDSAWLPFLDVERIRLDQGLPFRLVDLR